MKLTNLKKWLLGSSITGALIFTLLGSFMYSSIQEFFSPTEKIVTEADKKTHDELVKIEEMLEGQGKTSKEINTLLKTLLGENYQSDDNRVAINYLEERLADESIEEIVLEKDKFNEEIAKLNTENLRELKTSDLNELSQKSPETMLARLSSENKEVIESLLSGYGSHIVSNLISAGHSQKVITDVIDVADLRELPTSDLNKLSEKSPEAMLERLSGEKKEVIEKLAKDYNNNIIPNLITAGYASKIITDVIEVADLREIKVADLNKLTEKSPEAMLRRMKGEDKSVVEALAKDYSNNVLYYLISAGYGEKVVKEVIEVADLRDLKVSDLNLLSEKSPKAFLERLKEENKMVIEHLSKPYSNNILQNLIKAGLASEVITGVIEVADLREIRTDVLNSLSEKSPAEMQARLRGENEEVILYLKTRTNVLDNINWQYAGA